MHEERRKTTRIDLRRAVLLEALPGSSRDGLRITAELKDTSDAGLGFGATSSFLPGDRLRVTIPVAPGTINGRCFSFTGAVSRCEPDPESAGHFRVGLALDHLRLREQQAWHDLIQRVRAFVV